MRYYFSLSEVFFHSMARHSIIEVIDRRSEAPQNAPWFLKA
jgi:hypothetical protein